MNKFNAIVYIVFVLVVLVLAVVVVVVYVIYLLNQDQENAIEQFQREDGKGPPQREKCE
jgi:NADH:ubiquinone oxidoreductase subunit 6 (subunit J)